jgi:hypothetical protein
MPGQYNRYLGVRQHRAPEYTLTIMRPVSAGGHIV